MPAKPPRKPLHILRVDPSDSEHVSVLRELVDEYVKTWYPRGTQYSLEDERMLADLPGKAALEGGAAFIALHDRVPAGCVLLYPPVGNSRSQEIAKLYVRPKHRRKGVAGALMRAAGDAAVSNRKRYLIWTVYDERKAAMQFYKSIGAALMFTDNEGYWHAKMFAHR